VTDPPSRVVEKFRSRDGLVTALVCKNPKTSTKKTLDDRIEGPKRRTDWGRGNVFGSNEFVEQEEGDGKTGDIARNIAQPRRPDRSKQCLGIAFRISLMV
jgi:hypothetical protein